MSGPSTPQPGTGNRKPETATGGHASDPELMIPLSKAVDFDGGKVLLSKIKGQVYATSAFCTHVSRSSLSEALDLG